MKTFGELKPGDNLYRINYDKVELIPIISISRPNGLYLHTSKCIFWVNENDYSIQRTFSCKEALIAHIAKEINKLENRYNKLKELLDKL